MKNGTSHHPSVGAASPGGRTEAEARLLAIVRELAQELQPRKGMQLDVGLDSNLDRDLGLDSLGRAELMLRLDQAFKVRLPEQLISDAATSRDLLNAVLTAKPGGFKFTGEFDLRRTQLPEVVEPSHARTLLEVLEAHVRAHGSRPHIRLWVSDEEERIVTYDDLDRRARRAAFGLLDLGLQPGERAAIMLPTSADFFLAFFGVLMAGGVPVPIYPPFRRAQIEDHLKRQAGILRNAQARLIITDAEIRPLGGLLMGLAEDLCWVTTIADLSRADELATPVPASSETTALIQYTSGSTGDPKGVVLSHANLLANIRAMGETIEASSRDVFVSWLPLYHDMGLIGAWLGSLYFGAPTAIMPPLAFLANPGRWLWSIHRHRATLSAAPNFAFELCMKSLRDEDLRGLDLSSLRMVVNGAEAVSPGTIKRFTERFHAFGFRPEAMAPVYGLAECSVGLAFPPANRAPIVDRVQRVALTVDGEAAPAARDDATALEFVACGHPLPGHQIRIVDDAGREVADRHEGRLEFKGPSVTKGYFRNPEKTLLLFDGDWLDSGDLAYVAGGDVFLTGRVKDIIIRAGRHIYPHELEEAVGNIEGVRKGCVVAFASHDERTGTERLVVMAETRLKEELQKAQLRERIQQYSLELLETPPDEIVLVPPRTVPKTSSGKIRRSAARALYEEGTTAENRALWLQLTRLTLQGILHRVRRTSRRGAELVYAGYWWALLAVFGLVLWPLVVLLPRPRLRHALLGAGGHAFLRLTGIPLDVKGQSKIPEERAMIISNHASYLDGLVLIAAIPGEFSFVAKHELSQKFVAGTFLKRLGTIFVRRVDPKGGIEDTEAVVRAANRGVRLVILPEGTFSRMPGLLPFRLGAFLAATQAGIPVVPVTIRGTRMIFRSDQWFPRRGRISVDVGEPLFPDGNDFAAAVRLRDRCRAVILERSGEPDLARERVELSPD
ncbi:AMP-binding protein [Hyphomicrobium sp. 99]|uniref:AMP-binding protein n=1 Tax=Hyphomicrobium sp. 99 TaxID=1163419 RepID=UPI001FD91452|nr:AMP-binding protein [Hyphomicrobium sp. 99]